MAVAELIARLALEPHPEGGWYRETWRQPADGMPRGHASAILFLLEHGQKSHWHRIDAAEMWIFNAGSPLALSIATGEHGNERLPDIVLGSDVMAGQHVQHLYNPGEWQAAYASQGWTLVSCIVAPGFEFAGFELAAPDWAPKGIYPGTQ